MVGELSFPAILFFITSPINWEFAHKIESYKEFGFGKPTGVDLPNEIGGLVPTPEWKRRVKGRILVYGRQYRDGDWPRLFIITPLQLVQGVSIIAERGIKSQPHLLMKSTQGKEIMLQPVYPLQQMVKLDDPDNWNIVISAMQQVVMKAGGTASIFWRIHVGLYVAGKTGTAQVVNREGGEDQDENTPKALRNNHLFIAFAPIDHPQIAIAVLYEHGIGAPRLARKVMDAYFHIPPPAPPAPPPPPKNWEIPMNNNHEFLDDSYQGRIKKKLRHTNWHTLHLDPWLLLGLFSFIVFGMLILYSASNENIGIVERQLARLGIGFVVMFFFAQIPPKRYYQWTPWVFAIGLLLLVAVLFVGQVQHGGRRWFDLKIMNFQPSEIMKLAMPMMLAWFLSEKTLPPKFHWILLAGVMLIIPVLLTAKQPDLGTAIMIAVAGLSVLILAGVNWGLVIGFLLGRRRRGAVFMAAHA